MKYTYTSHIVRYALVFKKKRKALLKLRENYGLYYVDPD
jgi:hypothetical protein